MTRQRTHSGRRRERLQGTAAWLASVSLLVCAGLVLAQAAPADPANPAAPAPGQEDKGAAALPEGHQPSVKLRVDPAGGVRTGELIKLAISADAKLGDDVTIADQSFAPFEVRSKRARVEAPQGDRQRFVFDLELLALEPGERPIPAIELRVVTKDNFVGSVKTEATPFRVRSLLGNEPNAQPKPESKPVTVLEDNWIPIYILAGLLAAGLVALLTLLVSRYLQKRRARAVPPPPPRPPWEIAVEALAALRRKKQDMIDAGQGAMFVEQLNHVIREYLGGRFHFDGLETTTDEMLMQLKQHQAGLGFVQEVGMFLGRCDLVKFARVEPDADEVDLLFAKAQDLVHFSGGPEEGLTPEPPTPGPGEPPPAAAPGGGSPTAAGHGGGSPTTASPAPASGPRSMAEATSAAASDTNLTTLAEPRGAVAAASAGVAKGRVTRPAASTSTPPTAAELRAALSRNVPPALRSPVPAAPRRTPAPTPLVPPPPAAGAAERRPARDPEPEPSSGEPRPRADRSSDA